MNIKNIINNLITENKLGNIFYKKSKLDKKGEYRLNIHFGKNGPGLTSEFSQIGKKLKELSKNNTIYIDNEKTFIDSADDVYDFEFIVIPKEIKENKMKKSELRNIIKEEIKNIINEVNPLSSWPQNQKKVFDIQIDDMWVYIWKDGNDFVMNINEVPEQTERFEDIQSLKMAIIHADMFDVNYINNMLKSHKWNIIDKIKKDKPEWKMK